MNGIETSGCEKPPLRPCDRILPTQQFNRMYFDGPEDALAPALYELLARTSGAVNPTSRFDLETSDLVSIEEMASSPVVLSFLDLLVRITGARTVLEVGCFIGISTMTLARALPKGGRVIAIEKFPVFAGICRRNFAKNGLSEVIDIFEGDAPERLALMSADTVIDLAFVDGGKERYLDHFLAIEPLLRPGGLVVVDDILFQGDTLNEKPRTAKGAGVVDFLQYVEGLSGWARSALPISDGMILLQKPIE